MINLSTAKIDPVQSLASNITASLLNTGFPGAQSSSAAQDLTNVLLMLYFKGLQSGS